MKILLKIILGFVILGALAYGGYWIYDRYFVARDRIEFRTEVIGYNDIASAISATGTVEPEELVNVGAQVGGMITKFGTDLNGKRVDYGSPIKTGDMLATIDDALYTLDLRNAQAQELQALAAINSANASINQAKAKLSLAELNWNRAQELQPKGAISKSEYDTTQAEFITSKAVINVGEAQLKQAEAQLAASQVALDRAKRNINYCVIRSPVDGIIIDRRVNIGQTVVSSMNAPSLFLIAKDMKRMQVWVSVNEADIGQITPGLPVAFTVDTFQDQKFDGSVKKVRLNATMSQNVVTFIVEVDTDNSAGKLVPYLTASVKFILEKKDHVLTISNAALRYMPDYDIVPEEYKSEVPTPNQPGAGIGRAGGKSKGGKGKAVERTVWIFENGSIRPVKITTGLNDGINSEILSGDLKERDLVVTGTVTILPEDQKSTKPGASPFIPKMKR